LLPICASSGSACLADSPDPSHVIIAAMMPGPIARQSIRFSLGAENTAEEIREATAAVQRCAAALGGVR
jgi:cysteine desulfurase